MRPIQVLQARGASGGGDGSDPYFANVLSLLHFEGSNGSTTFTDATGLSWTAGGDSKISTAQSKFGTASGLFDGNLDQISPGTSIDSGWDMRTGDFTIELFAHRLGDGTGSRMLVMRSNLNDWALQWGASGDLEFYIAGGLVCSYAFSFTVGTWYHLAVTRSGTTVRLFVDGVIVASGTNSTDMISADPVRVGGGFSANSYHGHIDELRITKGVARYTAAFTPPAAPFPDS